MDELDTHLRNLKVTVEKIKNLENENSKEPVEKPKSSETAKFKDVIQKLRNLLNERNSLLLEIDELKKMAIVKATVLEDEITELRDIVKLLKILMDEAESSVNKRRNTEFQSRAEELRKKAMREV